MNFKSFMKNFSWKFSWCQNLWSSILWLWFSWRLMTIKFIMSAAKYQGNDGEFMFWSFSAKKWSYFQIVDVWLNYLEPRQICWMHRRQSPHSDFRRCLLGKMAQPNPLKNGCYTRLQKLPWILHMILGCTGIGLSGGIKARQMLQLLWAHATQIETWWDT